MKNVVASIVLLICGVGVLLATVDLRPYFPVNELEANREQIVPLVESNSQDNNASATPLETVLDIPPLISDQEQVFTPTKNDNLDDSVKNGSSAAASEIPVRQAPESLHPTTTPNTDIFLYDGESEQISSPLIEMEVTVLPVGEYPYSILLGTFLEQEIAQNALPIYQKRGISAHWVKVGLGEKGTRYRLFTGMFQSEDEAEQYLDQHQLTSGLVKPTSYSALVGIYRDKAQLANNFVASKNTGVIPYILGTEQGDYLLYVGSFYTFDGAINQCQKLIEAGLSCRPVKRSTIVPQ